MLALAGPIYRMDNDRIKTEIAPKVLEAGRELSQRLGFNE
jgi:DNA-binding IclR family transcriptional regulator